MNCGNSLDDGLERSHHIFNTFEGSLTTQLASSTVRCVSWESASGRQFLATHENAPDGKLHVEPEIGKPSQTFAAASGSSSMEVSHEQNSGTASRDCPNAAYWQTAFDSSRGSWLRGMRLEGIDQTARPRTL